MSEHTEQVALFSWAKMSEGRHPQLKNMFSIPNGGKRKNGWWEKSEGLKSGVPDIFLSVAKNGKHGLYIELKYGKNKPSKNQLEWLSALSDEGYEAKVCYGFDEAKKAICDYMGIE